MKNITPPFGLPPKVRDGEDGWKVEKWSCMVSEAPCRVPNGLNVWPPFKFSNAISLNLPPGVANLCFRATYSSVHTRKHTRTHFSRWLIKSPLGHWNTISSTCAGCRARAAGVSKSMILTEKEDARKPKWGGVGEHVQRNRVEELRAWRRKPRSRGVKRVHFWKDWYPQRGEQ